MGEVQKGQINVCGGTVTQESDQIHNSLFKQACCVSGVDAAVGSRWT